MYVDAQIAANDDEAVKQIFSRCLLHCLHVDLWRSYVRYMRKVNDSRGPEGRDEMRKAFEFMLSHIGAFLTDILESACVHMFPDIYVIGLGAVTALITKTLLLTSWFHAALFFLVCSTGFDITAGPVWLEYISFLKAAPVRLPLVQASSSFDCIK
jgi:hypothetical protein